MNDQWFGKIFRPMNLTKPETLVRSST